LGINETGGTGRRLIIHDIQALEAKLRSDRGFQIVVTTIIKIHFISCFRPNSQQASKGFDTDAWIKPAHNASNSMK